MVIKRFLDQISALFPRHTKSRAAKKKRSSIAAVERLEDRVVLAIDVWTGASSNLWSDDGNWQDGSAPVAGDDLVFPDTAANKTSVYDSVLGVSDFGFIDIQSSGYDISTSFASSLTLTGGVFATFGESVSTFTIDISQFDGVISVGAGATLEVGGAISGTSGLDVSGGGTLQLTGTSSNSYAGTTEVAAGTTLQLNKTAATAVPGNLTLGDGATVQLLQSDQIADAATVAVGEGALFDLGIQSETIDTLTLQGAAVTIDTAGVLTISDMTSNSTMNNETSTISGQGALDLNAGTVTFQVADDFATQIDVRISTIIQNGSLTKTGTGILALSGANTYAGDTEVSVGAIQVENSAALGAVGADVTNVSSGASVFFAGAGLSVAEIFNVAGSGLNNSGALGTLVGDTTLTGSVTMNGNTQIGASFNATLAVNGAIDDLAFTFDLSILSASNGRVLLGGSNGFDGTVNVVSGFLRVASDNALGDASSSTTVTIGSGASFELAGGITIPAAKTFDISGLPVSDNSKIVSVSGDNTIEGDIGITGGNNVAFDVAGGTTLSVAGAISGSRDFDKNNTGTLILTGINTNTGNVNVGDGTLLVEGSLATANLVFVDGTLGGSGILPAVTISGIGRLSPGNSPGILTTGDLTFSDSGSTYVVELDGTTPGTQYDQTDVTGTVTLANATLQISLGYGPAIGDTFIIINNDGMDPIDGNFDGMVEGFTFTLGAATLAISYEGGTNNNDVVLTVTDVTYTWDGGAIDNSLWSSPDNWVGDVTPTAGANLVFPANAPRLNSTNDFASNTNFHTITIAAAGYSLGGNAIDLDAGLSSSYSSGTSTLSFDIELQATSTIDVSAGGTLSLSGAISGTGFGVNKDGGGTLIYDIGAPNTYTGVTTVNAGTLRLGKTEGIDAFDGDLVVGDGSGTGALVQLLNANQIPDTSTITVNLAASVNFNGNSDTTGSLSLTGGSIATGGGTLTLSSGSTVTTNASSTTSTISGNLAFGGPNNFFNVAEGTTASGVDLEVSAVISSMNNLIKTDAGTLAFTGENTYSGGTNINAGVLAINHDTGAGTGVVNILGSGTLDVSGDITVSNDVNVATSATAIVSSAGENSLTGSIGLGVNFAIDVSGSSTLEISGVIDDSMNGHGLSKDGTGRLTLSNANTYGGTTTADSGFLRGTNSDAFGTGAAGILVSAGASLELGGGITLTAGKTITLSGVPVTESSKIISLSGDNSIQGSITLESSQQSFDVAGGTTLIVSGAIGGTVGFDKNGGGALTLSSSANNFSGNVNVLDGTLTNGANSVIPNAAVMTVNGEGAVYDLGDFDDIVAGLTLISGSVTGTSLSVLFSLSTYDVRDGLISAVLMGSNGLTKTTGGTVTLSGTNSYTGPTTVSAGTLLVDGSLLSGVTVAAGATLGGDGTLAGVTIAEGGMLAPGNSPGIVYTADLILESGSTYSVELNGETVGTEYDQTDVTGTVTLTDAILEIWLADGATIGSSYTIINNDEDDAVIGTFDELEEGATITLGASLLTITYIGGDGNDVVLTVTDVTYTWDGGGGDDLWSTAANWVNDVAPTANANLVFPFGAQRQINTNDLAAGTPFNSITVSAVDYVIGGNSIELVDGVTASYATGTSIISVNVSLAATQTIDVATGGSLILSGALSGSGSGVDKTGGGNLELQGATANTYSGVTTVLEGTLYLDKNDAIAIAGTLSIGDGVGVDLVQFGGANQISDTATISIDSATLDLNGFSDTTGSLIFTGGAVTTGVGVLTLATGATITTNASITTASISGNLAFAGPNNFITTALGSTVSGVDLEVSAVVSSGNNIIKHGPGTLLFSGENTYSGGTNITGGVLAINHATGAGAGDVNILSTGTLDVSGGITVSNHLNVFGLGTAIRSSAGANTVTGTVNLGLTATIDVGTSSSLDIASVIEESTLGQGLTKTGAGSLTLSASNSYTGDTTATSGFLRAANDNAFGSSVAAASITIESGATLELAGGISLPSTKTIAISGLPVADASKIMSVTGENAILGDIGITGANNVAIDVASGTTLTVSGIISGSRDLDKNNTGTLILSGNNTMTGGVNVGNGTLLVNGSLATASSVFVDGILGGEGTLPNVTISSIGTQSPGNSPGSLSTGDLTFQDSGSTYHVEINGATVGSQYDQTIVEGTITLAGATLSVSLGYTPLAGDSYVIIMNNGPEAVSGTFDELPEGATLEIGDQHFTISYVGGLSGNDVVLTPNQAPTAIQLLNDTVNENVAADTLVGSFSTTDPDTGDTFTYTLVAGDGDDDNAAFDIDESGDLVTVAAFDYETKTSYTVRVRSTDAGGLFTEQDFTISVLPLNDNAPVFTSSATFNVAENSTEVGTVVATDADLPAQTVTYSVTGGVDSSLFTIDPDTGLLSFITAPNFEVPTDDGGNNVYNVDVTADDGSGSTTIQNIAVTVTPVNDNAPVFTSPATFNVAENSTEVGTVVATDADLPAQTVTYSVTGGVDSSLFSIDPDTGLLSFITAPNFEVPTDDGANNVYNVDVTADDGSGSTTIQNIAVTVTPLNDNAPVFTSPATFETAENSTGVGTVVATDADLPAQTVTYSITGGADSSLFSINPDTGVLSFNSAPNYEVPTDDGANNVYNVEVTANDGSGSTTIQSIAVTVTPLNDNAPVFTSPTSVNVAENTLVAQTVTATDSDLPAQDITYSITGGVDHELFAIDPDTGVLSFLTSPDFEHPTDVGANNSYEVQVTANDGSGSTTSQDLTINVTNVVEDPVITLNPEEATYHVGKSSGFVDPTAGYQADVTETDYSAAVLTVSITANRQSKDTLTILSKGTDSGQISVKGRKVLYGGVEIGTFKGGTRANPDLVITFNSSASEAAVQALVKRISFATRNRRLPQPTRTVQMQITDVSGHDSNPATRQIAVV